MADTLEQLQAKLASAQSRSGTGSEYVQKANQNLINSLQQQISALAPATTSSAGTSSGASSNTSSGTNYYDPVYGGVGYAPDPVQNPQVYTGVSSSAITPPASTTYTSSGGGGGTSVYTPPVSSSGGSSNNISANTVKVAQATAQTNTTTPVNTPVNTPAQVQTTQPVATYKLADIASSNNLNLGWDAATGNVSFNGKVYTPAQLQSAGLQNIDGRWTGTSQQISSLLGLNGLRDTLRNRYDVGYQNGLVTLNGTAIPSQYTQGMINIDGRLYGTNDQLNAIANTFGTAVNTLQNQQNNQNQQVQQNQAMQDNQNLLAQLQSQVVEQKKAYDEMIRSLQSIKMPDMSNNLNEMTNLVKGMAQWKGQYDTQIKSVLADAFKDFNYDPDSDPLLKKAVDSASRSMMEEMNRRGILNSTDTADRTKTIREDLIPQYQQMAWERYNQNINNQLKRVDVMQKIDQTDYDRYANMVDTSLKVFDKISNNTWKVYENNLDLMNKQITLKMTNDKNTIDSIATLYQKAMDKVRTLGYVDNETSALTGLPVGTPSFEAMKYMQDRKDDLENKAANREVEIQKKVIDYKADMTKLQAAREEKQAQADKKTNYGKYTTLMSNMTAEQAQQYLLNNLPDVVQNVGDEYVNLQKYIDDKRKREQDLAEKASDNARAERFHADSEARADARSQKQSESFKKSPYFEDVKNKFDNVIKNYEENPQVVVNKKVYNSKNNQWESTNQVEKDWLRTPGSSEHKQIVTEIMKDPSLNDYERKLLLDEYKIPYSLELLKQYLGG